MADITDVATELGNILDALDDVDTSSISNYTPLRDTQKIAVLIVPFEQGGVMAFGALGPHVLVHAHRIVCEFWIKVRGHDEQTAMQRGRDICLQGLRLVAANPTLNGTVRQVGSPLLGDPRTVGRYDVLPRYEERGQIPYIVARLFVHVELDELNA